MRRGLNAANRRSSLFGVRIEFLLAPGLSSRPMTIESLTARGQQPPLEPPRRLRPPKLSPTITMAQAPGRAASASASASAVRLFDAHCHLQDPRIAAAAPSLIRAATASGVARFAVNGTSEVRPSQASFRERECSSLNFLSLDARRKTGTWWVPERSPDWMDSLRQFFSETPEAAVGETGLDKGSHGKTIDFGEQVEVFQQQLELAKELEKPVSVHCVRAFGDLLEILKRTGPFPAGALLHSYLGSAEMVPDLANLGCYFSLSGFLTGMKSTKAKKMVKAIPLDRILLETDAPDAVPKLDNVSPVTVPLDTSDADTEKSHSDSTSQAAASSNESLNHPANIHIVLKYVASLLEMPEAELAETSYRNATKLFSYPGSKVHHEAEAG
ncbi:putative deoxyribonuclease [Hordeum vulgare]|nr:putative deoxyribonuclease [Hordeum vulgare]